MSLTAGTGPDLAALLLSGRMNNVARRLKKLESVGRDANGLVPHSDAWYAFYEEKLFRLMDGEDIGNIWIPLDVTDRIIAETECPVAATESPRSASIRSNSFLNCL
jgi:hypothetical protein